MAVASYKCGEKECGSAAGRRKKGDEKLQRENLFLTKHWVESKVSSFLQVPQKGGRDMKGYIGT